MNDALRGRPASTTLVSTPSPLSGAAVAADVEGELPPGLQELADARRTWKRGPVSRAEWKVPARLGRFTTDGGLDVPALATPLEAGSDYLRDLGFPGELPFTRGVQPTMYRGRLWSSRLRTGGGSAALTNERLKQLLHEGQTGLAVGFDRPTVDGYDSDSPHALGAIGVGGVAVDGLIDLDALFAGIPLDKISTALVIDGPAIVMFGFYVALADLRGIERKSLGGTLHNDCLTALALQQVGFVAPRHALRLTTDVIDFCSKELPRWNTVSIDGAPLREAGSTAVQELAFSLASGLAYAQSCMARGLHVDDFGSRLSFGFAVQGDFFEEIAKLRAARRAWATLLQERCGAKRLEAMKMRIHSQAVGHGAESPHDPVRVALQALAAVLGGTQSLHTGAENASEEAMRAALRTQQILAEETGVASTIDPLGGSFFLEDLTRRIEREALAEVGRIDELGGMLGAIEAGYPQRGLAASAARRTQQRESGERSVVGLNKHVDRPAAPASRPIDGELQYRQMETLRARKQGRDAGEVTAALSTVRSAASSNTNVLPSVIAAARAHCSYQEVCDVLREALGS